MKWKNESFICFFYKILWIHDCFYPSALFITADVFIEVELKEIALAVRGQIQNYYNITGENSDDLQR